jgi:uncharacterized protein YdeI (YjbR/CyaY-like superfamily)
VVGALGQGKKPRVKQPDTRARRIEKIIAELS